MSEVNIVVWPENLVMSGARPKVGSILMWPESVHTQDQRDSVRRDVYNVFSALLPHQTINVVFGDELEVSEFMPSERM
jgi:hypothetical protein